MDLGARAPRNQRLVARPAFWAGSLAIILGLGMAHARWLAPEPVDFFRSEVSFWWAVLFLVFVVSSYASGLPELATSRWSACFRGIVSVGAAFLVLSSFQMMLARPLLPRSSAMLVVMVIPIWSVVGWNLALDTTGRAAERTRALLVAARGEELEIIREELAVSPESPASISGYLTPEQIQSAGGHLLVDEARRCGASILVLDTAAQASTKVVEQAGQLHAAGVRVRTLSLFYEQWLGKLPHSELMRVSLLFDVGELHRLNYARAKRAGDLIFAGLTLPLCALVAATTWILNPLFNPGPLLYRQPRVGKDGEEFTIIKLRTMRPGGTSQWTASNDPRITPLGRILRRTHLDELPQLVNIWRGDLSLIGPRPEQPTYVKELSEKIAFYELRHIIRPGLTGWAQVKQGYASDHTDAFEKLQYDFYYLRRQSPSLDARIIWRTVRGVLTGDGR